MRSRLSRLLPVLGLASAGILAACSGAAPAPEAAGTEILAAAHGQPLSGPSQAGPTAIVAEVLRAHGSAAHAGRLRVSSEARAARTGLTHVRLEQEIDGLRVYGAYAKVALTDKGHAMHLIARLAPEGAPLAAVRIDARDALRAALVHLGYAASDALTATERGGNMTRFARGAVFHREPTAEQVVFIDDAGGLRKGFLVETWSAARNQLDHTLVDGSGAVVSVERRTNNDRYNVFVEDPLKGAQTVVNGPGAGNAESPSGWLGTGAQTTVNITGNNAHAYLDADANNAADSGGSAVSNGDFLTAVDLTQAPSTASNRSVAVQNLFYLNNVVHDVLYRHGFNEAAGNFQVNNFGKGGLGNDSVNAEAQDGSGTDNANFSTPVDGSAPRMQMYLWTGSAPNGIVTVGASSYGAYGSTFGAALTTTGINGATALYNDGTGTTSDGCEASTTALTGKIALVDRGTCNFTVKVLNAQNAGAVGVIIVNNTGTDEAFAPSGTDRKVKIPSAMVSLNSGAALRMAVGSAANLRKSGAVALQIDGDIDSDVVFHEYGHGLTWRMIGGMSGQLAGAIGEGASDVVAFLLNGDDRIGEYAASTPAGIRRQPYSTYVGTYSTVTGAEVHNDGEIYAATMWDLWQRYAQAGVSTDTLLDDFVGGMNYTPATPAFENMRDGMLQQAAGTGRECLIWRAFANRGIGVGAKATISRRGALTITQSFTLPASCP